MIHAGRRVLVLLAGVIGLLALVPAAAPTPSFPGITPSRGDAAEGHEVIVPRKLTP